MSGITFVGSGFSEPLSFVKMYSDSTPMVKTEKFNEIVQRADTVVVKADSLTTLTTALFMVDSVNCAGGKVKNLVLPYIPGARQDRSNPSGDVLFTLASVAQMINARGFERVVVLDPHSDVAAQHIKNMVEYPLERIADRLWAGYTGIIAPDKGAKARAETFANAMGKDVFYGAKHRDVSTGRLSGFSVDVPAGGHYLVTDDICDGGGTFIGLAEQIKKCGAYADLYVSHGIFSKGTDELKKFYKNIYTTDSREIHERNEIFVLPVVERMIFGDL